jgi:hypothetical protein
MSTGQFRILTILTVLAGFLGGGVAVLLLQGVQAHAQEGGVQQSVTAREFILVDAEGHERVAATVDSRSVAGLHVFDPRGKERLTLTVDRDGTPLVGMTGQLGKPQLVLGVTGDDPVINMMDWHGMPRVTMKVESPGSPHLIMENPFSGKQFSAP